MLLFLLVLLNSEFWCLVMLVHDGDFLVYFDGGSSVLEMLFLKVLWRSTSQSIYIPGRRGLRIGLFLSPLTLVWLAIRNIPNQSLINNSQ